MRVRAYAGVRVHVRVVCSSATPMIVNNYQFNGIQG